MVFDEKTIFILQMFEADGSAMIYWHALGDPSSTDAQGMYTIGNNNV